MNAAETLDREPSLLSAGLTGGAVYYDAATDDARLTLANALAARDHGAVVVNHAKVTSILRDGMRAIGAIVAREGSTDEMRARVVVNATGVWENEFNSDDRARRLRGSKGAHISVPRERIGNREALTLISPVDGRVMFCLPAGRYSIIGTTDTWTSESPEAVRANRTEVAYLLRLANHYFPLAELVPADVVSAWAGIRPLASGAASTPGAISREHTIVTDSSGVIDVTGGKLTTYRSMAAEIVDRVQVALGGTRQRAPTELVELPGAGRNAVIAQLELENVEWARPLISERKCTGAHLVYGVREEMARTLADLLIRRTRIAFETRDHGLSVASRAADIVGPLLGWSNNDKSAQLRAYEQEVERMFSIADG